MRPRHFLASFLVAVAVVCPAVRSPAADEAFKQRLTEAARGLAETDVRIQNLDQAQRDKLASFVISNMAFILAHEMGHAIIGELKLPVLGRQEDAADMFATLAMLHIGTETSLQILHDTARGLYLLAERDKQSARPMYDEHGLDLQRAYQIVCLMVGSDPRAFSDIATRAKLPQERQESCQRDFDDARDAWVSLLKSHAATGAEPKVSFIERLLRWRPAGRDGQVRVGADYQPASGRLAQYRSTLMAAGLLESVSEFANKSLPFPRPITLKTMACGEQNAYWDDGNRELVLCYELVSDYVDLGLRAQ